MIDSHCHLADVAFNADLEAVVERAREAGVERALLILEAGNASEAAQARTIEKLWPEVLVAVGVPPYDAQEYAADPVRAAVVVREQLNSTSSARAIGEIGLDYQDDEMSGAVQRAVQRAVFRAQIKLARELGWPVVVHTREADEETLDILKREGGGELRGVLHSFIGNIALALEAVALGFYISVSGIITFPQSLELRNTLRRVPLDRLLTETDSPYLSPVPHRGQRNEPAYVSHVIEMLAGLRGMEASEMARHTTANFQALFRL